MSAIQPQQQPPPQQGKVLSDSTLVVIVCSIFASLVGAIFIVCLLRAVCRDLPSRLRAWRRRRKLGRPPATTQRRPVDGNGFLDFDDGTAAPVPTVSSGAGVNSMLTNYHDDSIGFMLMHTRQDSVEVIDTVGLGRYPDCDGSSDDGDAGRGNAGGIVSVCGSGSGGGGGGGGGGSKRGRSGGQNSLGPRGQPMDREYFV